jgi:hypothetical protein
MARIHKEAEAAGANAGNGLGREYRSVEGNRHGQRLADVGHAESSFGRPNAV